RVRRWRNVAVDSERGEKPLHANQKIEGGRHRGHLMVTYPTLPIEISAKKSRAFLGRQIENEGRRLSVAAPHDTGAKQALEEASEWTGVATDLEVIVSSVHTPSGTPECAVVLGGVAGDVMPT